MNKVIELPSIELVQKYINNFDCDKELIVADDVLSYLFGKYSTNQELGDILVKVKTLNSLYSTNIYATRKMANSILEKNIDVELQSGSLELVDDIALTEIGNNKKRRNYSFASKYCHWHQPDKYPIYDNLVESILWAYHKHFNFGSFKRDDLRQYSKYKEIIDNFKKDFGLTKFSYREIDKFLWVYAKSQ